MARIDSRDATPYDDFCFTCSTLGSHSSDRSLGTLSEAYWPAPAPTCQVASTTPTPARSPIGAALPADWPATAATVPPAMRDTAVATTRARFIDCAPGREA